MRSRPFPARLPAAASAAQHAFEPSVGAMGLGCSSYLKSYCGLCFSPARGAEDACTGTLLQPDLLCFLKSEFSDILSGIFFSSCRCDSVKKMLKLTKGWEEARDHALKVGTLHRCPSNCFR